VFHALQNVQDIVAQRESQLEIPRPLLHLDDLHTYWQAVWPGKSMSALYGQPGWERWLPKIARALAALHQSEIPGLERAWYVDRAVDLAMEDAHWIGKFLPGDAQRVLELASQIKEMASRLQLTAASPWVPIHGAFRLDQLLSHEDSVAMVDIDAVALGDPHYDVAEFITSLIYQHFRRGLPLAELMALAGTFRQAYTEQAPWPVDRRVLAWYTAAFLIEKLHGSLKGLQQDVLDKIDELFYLIDEHLRGV
jgi:aminoglycoside phosphotransferase (APT) family kinase protein